MEPRRSQLKVFRQGDPLTCQRIWDAIKQVRNDRKSATADNLFRYYCKQFNISIDVFNRQIKLLLRDQLIIQKSIAPVKGNNKGVEQIVFCIPNESEIDLSGKSDWYCFKCHKPGEVLACDSCPRVFHLDCLNNFKIEELVNGYVCPHCKDINLQPICDDFDRAELNHLLSFACARLEEKLPIVNYNWNPLNNPAHNAPFTTDRCAALLKRVPKQVSTVQEGWRSKFLLKIPVSLPKINDRTDRQVYKSLAQFQTDCATVVHNIAIFHGEHSSLADSARVMQRDCLYELEEIKLCPGCYGRSNKQEEKDWFCQPCDPPHELVFAKAKGYPFWPAKVLKINENLYDVRFFGVGHDRANLDKSFIRPITFNIQSAVSKRSGAWVKAMEELSVHQTMLRERHEAAYSEEDEEARVDCSDVEKPNNIEESKTCRVSINRLTNIDSLADHSSRQLETQLPTCSSENLLNSDSLIDDLSLNSLVNSMVGDPEIALENTTLKKEIQTLKESHTAEIKQLQESDEKKNAEIKTLKENHEKEIEALKEKHAFEIKTLKEECEHQIVFNKKKQWCTQCGKEGSYYCCMNVTYCSADCQQIHWRAGHKEACRRKREVKSEKEKKK